MAIIYSSVQHLGPLWLCLKRFINKVGKVYCILLMLRLQELNIYNLMKGSL